MVKENKKEKPGKFSKNYVTNISNIQNILFVYFLQNFTFPINCILSGAIFI